MNSYTPFQIIKISLLDRKPNRREEQSNELFEIRKKQYVEYLDTQLKYYKKEIRRPSNTDDKRELYRKVIIYIVKTSFSYIKPRKQQKYLLEQLEYFETKLERPRLSLHLHEQYVKICESISKKLSANPNEAI